METEAHLDEEAPAAGGFEGGFVFLSVGVWWGGKERLGRGWREHQL